jgi:hypothetical protein
MSGWQSIESAPREIRKGNAVYGELIYALIPYNPPSWTIAWWDTHYGCFDHVGSDGPHDIQPTHWMELAAPPAPPT